MSREVKAALVWIGLGVGAVGWVLVDGDLTRWDLVVCTLYGVLVREEIDVVVNALKEAA